MDPEIPTSSHHIRGSVILLSLRVFGVLFLVDTIYAAILLLALYFGVDSDLSNFIMTFLWLIHTAKFVFILYLILRFILPWATTSYYLCDHQIICYSGIIKIDENIYELAKLREVDLIQTWLGKLLDYGTIRAVVSSSGYTAEFKLSNIADPKKYERILRKYLAEAGGAR